MTQQISKQEAELILKAYERRRTLNSTLKYIATQVADPFETYDLVHKEGLEISLDGVRLTIPTEVVTTAIEKEIADLNEKYNLVVLTG